MCTPLAVKLALHNRDKRVYVGDPDILKVLQNDVRAIETYRVESDSVCIQTFKLWFPDVQNIQDTFEWIREVRDFVFTINGLRILKNGCLREKEPLQYAMLRIARKFSGGNDEYWRIMYDLISCGMVHPPSMLAAVEQARDSVVPDEACSLLVGEDIYDRDMAVQTEKISILKRLVVGGTSNASKLGCFSRGMKLRSSCKSFTEKLNPSKPTSRQERKLKTARYIYVHNDTILEVMKTKSPSCTSWDNVSVGLMVSDYFMECVRENKPWYLFNETTKFGDKTLADYTGDEYVKMYGRWVDQNLYSKTYKARYVMEAIIKSIFTSCAPYIIWMDNVNRYNNQNHLGIIKRLNFRDEIMIQSESNNSSSCFMMSCNMAMYKDFPDVIERACKFMFKEYGIRHYHYDDFALPELARYAYIIGYMSTVGLNIIMGEHRQAREIGINPLGVYDMALLANEDHVKVCRIISEAFYKGAVQSSCDHYTERGVLCDNYVGSEFNKGRPQWALRNGKTTTDWTTLVDLMKDGMANSMLTSQVPNEAASLLTGVTQSVTLPIAAFLSQESENGGNKCFNYGTMYRSMNGSNFGTIPNYVDSQIAMYAESLDFFDHSQSIIYTMNLQINEVLILLAKTYVAKLKATIYFMLNKQ